MQQNREGKVMGSGVVMTEPKLKKIHQWEPLIGQEEVAEVVAAIESSWINEAHRTRQLEKELAEFLGVEFAVLTNNGTVAIALGLMASGVGKGDEVIVPDFTFIATANAVKLVGAEPVLVDIRAEDLTIDAERVEQVITPRTRAIIPVHLNGRRADMEALREIADRHDLMLVEDAAQALGSAWQGRYLGTEGDAGCFSLATTKIITTGQGGFVVTNDATVRQRLIELKDHGRLQRSWNRHPALGFNFKFTDLQAAVGLAQIRKLPDRLQRMKEVYQLYESLLADVPQVTFLSMSIEHGASPWFVDIYVTQRERLARFLDTKGVETRPFYPPLHTQGVYRCEGEFPNATHVSQTGLWLPSSITLDDSDIGRICEGIREFYRQQGGIKEAA
jgi:perosamine synthetase